MKKILCLLLVLVMTALTLASCGKKNETTGTTAKATAAETGDAAATTSDKTTLLETTVTEPETISPELMNVLLMDPALKRIKIEYSTFTNAEKASKNNIYIEGPDAVEEGVTPEIQIMVYERNRQASELLGTTVEYTYMDKTWGAQAPEIQTIVQGNAADAPDLFVNMIYDLNRVLLTVGAFRDIWSISGSLFDFEAVGWMSEWMESASLTGDRAYILASDYFVDILRAMSVLPFNITMMDANSVKLAPAILGEGETLGAGEDLSERFFDFVEEGYWTWEVLGKLCEAIWVDTDGSGDDSIGDQLGIIADEYGGLNAAIFIYSCGETLTETYVIEDQTSPNYGKQWVRYPADSATLGAIFDAVAGVFSGSGSFSTRCSDMAGSTPDQPGVAYHHIKFGQGELLTAGGCLLGALEDDAFQQMSDLYSVVPLPKVDVNKNYNTFIHNVGDAGAINVNINPNKAKALTAYLEFCTETSPEIREEFLEIVTKYKTTVYNQGTDRMLDIIYDGVINGRDKTIEDAIGGGNRWHQMMKDGGKFLYTSANVVTNYETNVKSKQTTLDGILEKWYALPTAAQTTAE